MLRALQRLTGPMCGAMQAASVCSRCRVRLTMHDMEPFPSWFYQEEMIKAELGQSKKELAFESESCSVCLDVTSDAFISAIVATMKQTALDEEREIEACSPQLNLPSALSVRDHAFQMYMQSHGFVLPEKSCTIKSAFKALLYRGVQEALGCVVSSDGPLKCQIMVKHPQVALDMESFGISVKRTKISRKRKWALQQRKDTTPNSQDTLHEEAEKVRFADPSSRAAINKFISGLTSIDECQQRGVSIPPVASESKPEFLAQFQRDSISFVGKYLKLSRELSQTPWSLNKKSDGPSSVEECLATPILSFFKPRDYSFHSAGREDIDVRMLGTGRDFVVQMVDPRRVPNMTEVPAMADLINASSLVQVKDPLIVFDNSAMEALKFGEDSKRKLYRAKIWIERAVEDGEWNTLLKPELLIQQKTPVRVSHRRTMMVRPRLIHSMSLERVDEHHYMLDLDTQAGTYIKEFVHGDRGRTFPSIASLFQCKADILALDVMGLLH